MHPTLRYGLILGLAVAAWTFVNGFTGWYRHPELRMLFFLVIPFQVGLLVWALRRTAPEGGYGRQLWTGVSISLLASLIIYAGSLLFTTVVFPSYFRDMEALGRQVMAKQDLTPEQIEAAVKAQALMLTPRATAMAGVVGTMLTGFLTSAVAAVWLRKK